MAHGRAAGDARHFGKTRVVDALQGIECAQEPIHIPGSVQPHGILLSVGEDDFTVRQMSLNAEAFLGLPLRDIRGYSLSAVLGPAAAEAIERHTQSFTDLRSRNPLYLEVFSASGRAAQVDAVLHRVPAGGGDVGRLVVELEASDGLRPFSFPNTYQAVREAVSEMSAELGLEGLYSLTARHVRALTGFDRVMIYRFDREFNGEVVAEDRRADLEPFLGLHYPASDIPPQARRLYEKNWLRVIPDVDYDPAPLVPATDPDVGEPLDLTFSVLRSVSPVHIEYLRNMGVRASMSISLLRNGALWGLIACHHYCGPHLPPFGVRAAAEFLGSTLSLRLVDRVDDEAQRAAVRAERALATVSSRIADYGRSLAGCLVENGVSLDLVPADTFAVVADGRLECTGAGNVSGEAMQVLHEWAQRTGGLDPAATDNVRADLPELRALSPQIAGALAVALPEGHTVAWLRRERLRTVDWGGDPHSNLATHRDGSAVKIGPRASFERWRETVRDRSDEWSSGQVQLATRLRALLVEGLYARERTRARAAEALQRSLLPEALPAVDGWQVSAWYEPSPGGRIGGDWYDAVLLPDGRVAVVVGDVAGHGLDAAGVMARFSNTLRAFLLRGDPPVEAVRALDAIVAASYPEQMATLVVAAFAPDDGDVEIVLMGHPSPVHVGPRHVRSVSGPSGTPLGLASFAPEGFTVTLQPGDALVLFSDGLVERRTEPLDVGLKRLQEALCDVPAQAGESLIAEVRDPESDDDLTLLVLQRSAPAVRRGPSRQGA